MIKVNGEEHKLRVEENETLLQVLRDRLRIKSVKAACWRGECGLCTVLLEGKPVKSCLVLACEVDGSSIVTVEGLNDDLGEKIKRAFVEEGAIQCGFCTPAFILATYSLLRENPNPSREEVVEAINGLICRCTGYHHIVKAVMDATKGDDLNEG